MAQASIRTQKKNPNVYDLSIKGLTLGELYALRNALTAWEQGGSMVGADLLAYLQNGTESAPEVKQYFKDHPF